MMKREKLSPWERGALMISRGDTLHYPSPNQKLDVFLGYAGDIRFGPCYFTLSLGDVLFRSRVFGGEIFWSDDSKYFAAQEWLSTEERKGPHTLLVLFDVEEHLETVIAEKENGFISALRFYPESLTYQEESGAARSLKNVSFDELSNWEEFRIEPA